MLITLYSVHRVDNGFSAHADNRKKDILILGKGPADGLDETAIIAEAEYPINFTEKQGKFCWNRQYNETNSFFVS